VRLHWEPLPLADLAGYCVHIDIDSLGFDYDDLVDVGNETSVFLSGLELGIGYRVAVSSYDIDGNPSSPGRPIWVVAEAVDVPEGLPNQILTSSYPNPFNPSTTIRFSLPAPGTVTLTVYDLTGRRIARIIDGDDFPVGHHEAVWSGVDDAGNSVSSGVYLYRLEAGEFVQTRKMTLLK
jgi:hypothetical protein